MNKSMQEKLDQFNNRKKSPTETLIEPLDEEEEEESQSHNDQSAVTETDDKFQHLTKKKKKVEDTHSRKTFLVRNDLIKRLNSVAKKSGHGFLTEFINAAIEYGLEQVEDDD